jgi:pilus assembly protein CpaE
VTQDRQIAAELKALLALEAYSMRVVQVADYKPLESPPPASDGPQPRVCFLDVCSSPDTALTLLARLAESPSPVPVICLLREDHPDLALRCLRMGAAGCLIYPFDADQLLPVLSRIGYLDKAARADHRPKIISVVPAKGSSGASTLAANLACAAGRAGFSRVLLADMDPLAGTLDFMLKLKSTFSFADALAHAEQLDVGIWRGLVSPYRGLDVLLSPENPTASDPEIDAVTGLISYVRRSYDLVVLDTGGPYSSLGQQLIRLSDEVLLVTTTELGSFHGAKRALSQMAAIGVPVASLRLVLSRWRKGMGFEQSDIETALELPVYHAIPNDPQAVEEALLQGRPVAAGSPFGKSVAELGARLFDRGNRAAEMPPSSRGFRSFFSKNS